MRAWCGFVALFVFVFACAPSAPPVNHLTIAKQLATDISQKEHGTDYSNSAWEQVAQELQLVPEESSDKAEANTGSRKFVMPEEPSSLQPMSETVVA